MKNSTGFKTHSNSLLHFSLKPKNNQMRRFLARKSILFHLVMLRLGRDFLSRDRDFMPLNDLNHANVRGKKRILIVGMSESPHLHSWIEGIADSEIAKEIWLFPSDFPVRKHKNSKVKVKEFPYFTFGTLMNLTFRFLDILTNRLWRSYFLYREIKRIKPTHLHFHETQHGAYLYNPVAKHPKNRFSGKLILSTWGSDLIVYGKMKSHTTRVQQTLSWVQLLKESKIMRLRLKMDLMGNS